MLRKRYHVSYSYIESCWMVWDSSGKHPSRYKILRRSHTKAAAIKYAHRLAQALRPSQVVVYRMDHSIERDCFFGKKRRP
jgi:hypothetical protein